MKKLLLILMTLAMSIPIWASDYTVTIRRGEVLEQGNVEGVLAYYCIKDGVMMTFTDGLDNENYLVEHHDMRFEIRSANYIIKKVVFHCMDNSVYGDNDSFYWGPTTISAVTNFTYPGQLGSYSVTNNGYDGVWQGQTSAIQFITMGHPVRFGSVEIVYEKLDGDIFDLVTNNSQIVDGKTYIIVSQNHDKVMAFKKTDDASYPVTNIVGWLGQGENESDKYKKVKVDGNACLFKMENLKDSTIGSYTRKVAWFNTLNGYIRENSGNNAGLLTNYSRKTDYGRAIMYISNNAYNYLCWFKNGTGNSTHPIRYDYSDSKLMKIMSYDDTGSRVWLYKLAESYHVYTQCAPANTGNITLGNGVVDGTSQENDTVHFFVSPTGTYSIDEVTVTNLSTNEVTVLQPTSTGSTGNEYSFEMPAADVTITANFVPAYEIHTVSNPTDGGGFNFLNGYTDFNGQTMSNEGKTVTFKPTPADGYIFNSVTYTDDVTGVTTTLTPDANGVYSFVMPGNDVTLTANFEEATDLYLLGTANGRTGWAPTGPKFTYDAENEKYYIDVYFKGGNDDPNTDPSYGYFSLTKKIDDNWNWGNINGYRLGAQYNNFWVEDGHTATLYPNHNDDAFKIPPGVYRLEVDKEMTNISIIKYELTFNFDPVSGTIVEPGQVVTASSNLDDLVHAINPNEVNAVFYNTTDNWATQENDNTAVITNEGYTTVTANANIGYIHVEGAATYEIVGDLYLLGTANGQTGWHTYGPKFTYDSQNEEYYIDVYFKGGNDDPNTEQDKGFFNLTTRIDMNDDWNYINQYRLGPIGNPQPIYDENIQSGYQFNLQTQYPERVFRIKPGVFRIHVNKEKTRLYVTEYPITITFDPVSGSTVTPGTVASAASNLEALVHAINPNEDPAYLEVSEDNTYHWHEGNTMAITQVGRTRFHFRASIGYIVAQGVAEYFLDEPEDGFTITTVILPEEYSSGGYIVVAPSSHTAHTGHLVTFNVGNYEGYQIEGVEVVTDPDEYLVETQTDGMGHYTFVMPHSDVIIILLLSEYEEPLVPTTLKDIEDPDNPIKNEDDVIVADELIGVWKARQYLWAKDQAQSNYFLPKGENTIDFVRNRMKREGIDWQPRDWDQSNWVILDFGGIDDFRGWQYDPAIYQAMQAEMDRFVDNKIKPGTITGTYNCKGLSTTDWHYNGDPYATKRHHLIALSEVPDCDAEPTGLIENSLGYPGYDEDPLETKHYPGHPERYMYNHYMPYNFLTANTVSEGISASQASISHYNLNPNDRYFFMAPKDQEVAHVWAVWVGQKEFEDPIGPVTPGNDPEMMERDVFATYQYSPADDVNKYGFSGAFYVESWYYNRLYDENGAELYGKPGVDNDPSYALQVDKAYMFHIAIQYPARVASVPQAPIARAPEASRDNPGAYNVYPLDMMGGTQTETAVQELYSRDAVTIKSMTYYNMMGQASDKPFDGINVIVVTYSDGSSRSWKVLK